ncbi:MAG: D-alanyl-D-alanine carboxypeptidase/D-alanyl-D-alanine-endopeptidase [Actinomycetota bacterium]|nr:D-alanyl-D-alanine carboxypeptidase/D-alanyl-D-alanine-endopeptidase [Actinomycetota bacterium]
MRRPGPVAPVTIRRVAVGLILLVAALVSQVQAQSPGSVAAGTAPAVPVESTEAPTTAAPATTTTTEPPTTTTTTEPPPTTTTTAPAPAPPGFVEAVQGALGDPRFESATVGLSVWMEGSGMVVSQHADTALRPGSTEKLLVAWGAYGTLGPTASFVTDVRADGEVDGSTLHGHLVLVGGGDPSLRSTGGHSLERLATLVRRSGVTQVTGDLVVDEAHFDSERRAPGWTSRHVPYFVGPLSALAVDGNSLRTDPEYVANPALGNLGAFRAALAAQGVNVAGGDRMGTAPDPTKGVASVRSAPVSDLVNHMLTNSDNFYAEMLLKDVGQRVLGRGTSANGMGVVHQLAAEAGVQLSGRAADGSGLSRDNTRRPREWVELLVAARSTPWFDQLLGGLPIGGRSGTLVNRFRGTPAEANVRAKTGSVQQTRALSGYLTTAGGRQVVFSLIVNSDPVPPAVIAAMDNVVSTMAASRN